MDIYGKSAETPDLDIPASNLDEFTEKIEKTVPPDPWKKEYKSLESFEAVKKHQKVLIWMSEKQMYISSILYYRRQWQQAEEKDWKETVSLEKHVYSWNRRHCLEP